MRFSCPFRLRDLSCQIQTDADTVLAVDFRLPVKPGEDLGLPLQCNSLSRIPHMDLREDLSFRHTECYTPAARRIFYSVIKQVVDRLLGPFPVMGQQTFCSSPFFRLQRKTDLFFLRRWDDPSDPLLLF